MSDNVILSALSTLKSSNYRMDAWMQSNQTINNSLKNICIGTPIEDGSYAHYIQRGRIENDLHSIGAFLLMLSEMAKLTIGKD